MLIQGTEDHPDLQSISQALDSLYGASLGPLVRKNGDIQTWGFYLSFLEDRFALEGDRVLEPMAELLGEVLLRPRLVEGALDPRYVEREKENLISTIETSLNDKRVYAERQMLRAMCREDSFGIPRLGDAADVAAVTPEELYRHYRQTLGTSQVELFYAGQRLPGGGGGAAAPGSEGAAPADAGAPGPWPPWAAGEGFSIWRRPWISPRGSCPWASPQASPPGMPDFRR